MMKNPVWQRKKIGELFDVQLSKMLNEKAKKGKLLPYLANFNVRWGSFDLSRLNEMSFSETERKKFSLKPGDLLMCEGGEIGRCAVWQQATKSLYYQKALHRLRPLTTNISSDFVYYYMQYIATKGELPKLVGETSIAHLTREKLICLQVPVPSRHEQEQITTVLSSWDKAIGKTERLIITKGKRFSWLLDKMINEESVRNKWMRKKLGEVFSKQLVIEKGKALIKDNIVEGIIPVVAGGQTYAYYNKMATHEMATITISASGGYAGFVWFHDYPIWASDCNVIYAKNASLLFFYYVLKSQQDKIYALQSGGAQPHVYAKDLTNLIVPVPPIEIQKQIAATLDVARHEIDLLKKQADAYRRQKRGLMQELLTGQWRVKNDVP
jgi:type I restriction enzyme, S subunit